MSRQTRNRITTDGVFLSVPPVFDGADGRLTDAFKMQFSPVLAVPEKADEPPIQVAATFAADRVLLDFGAIEAGAVDLERAQRDCDLIKAALQKHPEVIRELLDAVTGNRQDLKRIVAAAGALGDVGLTEQHAYQAGGGIIAVVLIAAAALLATGCATCDWGATTHRPAQYPPTMSGPADAGVG